MKPQETIRMENLSIGYRTRHHVKCVSEGITERLQGGELTCLLGENGAGKSTLLRTLSGFQPALSGHITILGKSLQDYSEHELATVIGVVLTEKSNLQNMTVTELVGMGRSPYTGFWGRLSSDDRAKVEMALEMVGITFLRERLVQTLSDGERQKVMIAKALAQQTPVIFLDEPTAFLDYPSKVEMLQLLHRLSRATDKTIFLSTHDLELALQIADVVWLMRADDSLIIGTPQQLAQSGDLSKFVEQRGIVFDRETLSVRVVGERSPIGLTHNPNA